MRVSDLPGLNLLPAFEAAGRLLSFKEAARELHLTPSAISQQIKLLEEALGVPLFERRARAVVLTGAGTGYLEDVQRTLADLALATRRVRRRAHRERIRLSTIDFLAYEFLMPRLAEFRRRFPGVELSVQSSMQLVDFQSGDFDAAIRVGGGPWPGLTSHPVGSSIVAVVCSPALARTTRTRQQLLSRPLIELRGQEHRGWSAILRGFGIPLARANMITLDSYLETLLAAEQGLGMAFGLFPLSTAWVSAGRLAVPHALRTPLPGQVALVHRASDPESELFAAFALWLAEEYRQLPALSQGRIVQPARPRAVSR